MASIQLFETSCIKPTKCLICSCFHIIFHCLTSDRCFCYSLSFISLHPLHLLQELVIIRKCFLHFKSTLCIFDCKKYGFFVLKIASNAIILLSVISGGVFICPLPVFSLFPLIFAVFEVTPLQLKGPKPEIFQLITAQRWV